MKFIIGFLLFFSLFIVGCDDKSVKTSQDDIPNFNPPIANDDANLSIDENLPPEPAIEDDFRGQK